MSSLKDNLKNV